MNIIERHKYDRRTFDPASKKDIEEYKYFLTNNKWKNGCPFYLDWPYLTIPDMIKDKVTKFTLKIN